MKKLIKSLMPPLFIEIIKKYKNHNWQGDYSSWQEAKENTVGYDSDEILQKVKTSLLKVKNKEAIFERDSVLFNTIQYSWPLLSGLMMAHHDRLSVLDFGGSLGSSYFQNKKFLDELNEVTWSIVEQEHFIDIGKQEFEDDILKFYHTVDECIKEHKPNVLLLSSVLQYIEDPYILLNDILKNSFEYILIDRTPFSTNHKDVIKVQVVPASIYKASYPCWFFSENKLVSFLMSKNYKLIEDFDGLDGKREDYYFKGMIWRRNV